MPYHNDTIIKTQEDFFMNICTSHFIYNVCMGEGAGDRTELQYFDPALLWPSTLCLSRSPGLLNRRPRGSLCWVMAFFTASYQQLLWTPTASYQQLLWTPTQSAFPTTLVYNSVRSLTVWLLSWLSYIIVERPLSRLLDLWNRMFNRHQAEITVMQFTGHSVPVHQSMSVPWEFFYLVTFHQPISAHAISSHNCH